MHRPDFLHDRLAIARDGCGEFNFDQAGVGERRHGVVVEEIFLRRRNIIVELFEPGGLAGFAAVIQKNLGQQGIRPQQRRLRFLLERDNRRIAALIVRLANERIDRIRLHPDVTGRGEVRILLAQKLIHTVSRATGERQHE